MCQSLSEFSSHICFRGQRPALDKDLRFGQCIQPLAVEKFIPEFPDEGFDVTFSLGAAGLEEEDGYAKIFEPVSNHGRREFRAVIRPNMFRLSPRQE